jgi:hypothetical protein
MGYLSGVTPTGVVRSRRSSHCGVGSVYISLCCIWRVLMEDKPIRASVIISGRREDILAIGRKAIEILLDGKLALAREAILKELYPDG